jgi:membrane-associated phospholipid phosphatase
MAARPLELVMSGHGVIGVRANRLAWGLIGGLLLVDLTWLAFSQLSVVPLSLVGPVAMSAGLALAARYYRYRRGETRLADALELCGQMTAFMTVGALFSYLVATLGMPMQDAALYAIDQSLGLDWLAYLKAVDKRPLLGTLFRMAYDSFIPQVLVLLLVLSFSGLGHTARIMILAMMLSGIVTILISGLLPAMAMFVHLNLSPADYPNLSPSAAFVHVKDIHALRAGLPLDLDLSKAEGIITFPSYHAALGLLMLLAGLSHPVLRWPFSALNLTMIAATPIDGGHYFIDVAAGLLIAATCYLLARRLLRAPRGLARQDSIAAPVAVAES